MSAARKQLPPPGGGEDLAAALQARLRRNDTDAPGEPRTSATDTTSAIPRTRARKAAPAMDRRSWYMPKATADALAAAIDELYWSTHRPKHEVLAALVDIAVARKAEAQERLTG